MMETMWLFYTLCRKKTSYIEAPKKRCNYKVERRVGSSKKLMRLTEYKPHTELNDGLSKIIQTQLLELI